jgi:diguanylate cyclase (GGDEF)-like protein
VSQLPARLRLLIALMFSGALASLGYALFAVSHEPMPAWWRLGLACGVLAASRLASLDLRFRGHVVGFDWGEGALLLGLVLLPSPWLTLLMPVCLVAARALVRRNAIKTLYNAATTTIATAAAGMLAGAVCDLRTVGLSWRLGVALVLAALVFTAVMDIGSSAAIAFSQAVGFFPTLRVGVGLELLTGAGNVGAALLVVAIAGFDRWLLATLPMLVIALQITYHSRLRGQQERKTWTQLEHTTRAFTQLDPAAVAEAAIEGILALFQADRVEVLFRRPDGSEARYAGGASGPGERAAQSAEAGPNVTVPNVTVPLGQPEEGLGTITLYFAEAVALNGRERHALATLATALAVALANAERYETTRGLAEEKAREALTDPLTGVGNRALLREAGADLLARAAEREQAGAMLLVDLDHFKEVNDTLGYDTGDRLLVEVARRLKGAVAEADLVVRLGSHVFAVLLADVAMQSPEATADRLIGCLDEPMILDGLHLRAPASIGIAGSPGDAGSIRELLRLADAALLRAKGTAVRWVRYTADLDQPHADRLVSVEESRAGIANGEFLLHYQPKVDVPTGRVMGVEALIRWQHPTRGFLAPDTFMPAIEHSVLVHEFTLNILRMGLRDCAGWLARDPARNLAVNLSARNLLNPNLPQAVLDLLEHYGVPSGQLVLEVTETAIMSDLDTVDAVLSRLRASGVQLSLDDFGTGYSSLTFLSRIPVDEVKIDRSFVSRMLTSNRDDLLVRGTISLAHELGLRVVAEGVETREEHLRLVALNCERGQGYYYSRPVPIDALHAMADRLPAAALHRPPAGTIPPPRDPAPSETGPDGRVVRAPSERQALREPAR